MGNFSSTRTVLRFIDHNANSNKFYEVTTVDMGRHGALVIKRWGRATSMYTTTGGQSQVEIHGSTDLAEAVAERIINTKFRRGYSLATDHQSLDLPESVVRAFYRDAPTIGVPTFTTIEEAQAWLDAHTESLV